MPWVSGRILDYKCGSCRKLNRFELPELSRLCVCLDQNVLSEMMKIESDHFPQHRRAKVDPKWHRVFEICSTACRDLTAVFPLSDITTQESSLFEHGPAVVRLAEHLACGVKIHDNGLVRAYEAYFGFKNWIHHDQYAAEPVPQNLVFDPSISEWPKTPRIEITNWPKPSPAEQVRISRQSLHDKLLPIYDKWRSQNTSYSDVFQLESKANGHALAKSLVSTMIQAKSDPELAIFGNDTAVFFSTLLSLKSHFEDLGKCLDAIVDYLHSDEFSQLPSVLIRSSLYAAQSRRIAGGMPNPKLSDKFDIERIVQYLPYVDILFIENHFASIVREIQPKLPAWARRVKVFSPRTADAFCEHLLQHAATAPPDITKLARQIYGKYLPE